MYIVGTGTAARCVVSGTAAIHCAHAVLVSSMLGGRKWGAGNAGGSGNRSASSRSTSWDSSKGSESLSIPKAAFMVNLAPGVLEELEAVPPGASRSKGAECWSPERFRFSFRRDVATRVATMALSPAAAVKIKTSSTIDNVSLAKASF